MSTEDELKAQEKEYYDLPNFVDWEKQKEHQEKELMKRLLETNDCV